MSSPDTAEEISSPPTIGMVSRPASVGEQPPEICRQWPRKTLEPNIAMPPAALATTASVVMRSRNSRSGGIRSVARVSVTRKAAVARAAPPRNSAVSVEAQAKLLPASVTQVSSAVTAVVRKVAPR